MLIISLAFLAAFLVVLSGGLFFFYREAMLDRLAEVTSRPGDSLGLLERILSRRRAHVQSLIDPFQADSYHEVLRTFRWLARNGFFGPVSREESAVNFFYAAKVLVPPVLSIMAFVTGIYEVGPFFVFGVTAGLGFMMPDFWLGNRMAARQLAIRLGLPDVLDLLVICIEAGLGLDQAMARVCDEVKNSQPEIADEFSLIAIEQRAGRTRADSWRNLAERSGVVVRPCAGLDRDSGRPVWNECCQNAANAFGYPAHQEEASSGGGSGQNNGKTGLPAGVFHFSFFVCRSDWPVGNRDGRRF